MASSITRLDYYQSKLDHVKEMLNNLVHHKQLDFKAVLMDSWYAAK
jgi:hypothetical protein